VRGLGRHALTPKRAPIATENAAVVHISILQPFWPEFLLDAESLSSILRIVVKSHVLPLVLIMLTSSPIQPHRLLSQPGWKPDSKSHRLRRVGSSMQSSATKNGSPLVSRRRARSNQDRTHHFWAIHGIASHRCFKRVSRTSASSCLSLVMIQLDCTNEIS
jgi:hypothetical protein